MSGAVGFGLQNDIDRQHEEHTHQLTTVKKDGKINEDSNTSGPKEDRTIQPYENQDAASQNAAILHDLDANVKDTHISDRAPSPALHVNTHMEVPSDATTARLEETPTVLETPVSDISSLRTSLTSPSSMPILGSALRTTLSASSLASTVSLGSGTTLTSPYLAAMTDLTPLPSPMTASDPSKRQSWRLALGRPTTPRSREGSMDEPGPSGVKLSPVISAKKRKGYGSLLHDAMQTSMTNAVAGEENTHVSNGGHGRHRSISDFVPEHLQNFRQRVVTFGPGDTANFEAQEHRMHREEYLADKRGVATSSNAKEQQLPTPPASTSSIGEIDDAEDQQSLLEDGSPAEYLVIHCGMQNKRRKFRPLRQLGQGTFSKVVLATRERIPPHPTPEIEEHLDPQKLVAVKIVEQGPAGGADEQRIEIGLKREIEMLKSLSHPSLVHLKACEYEDSRALLVLTYCPGGDLFELASQKRDLLTPALIQRIFSELVSAVRYLHSQWVVHRDMKLENVLVNISASALRAIEDPRSHPAPLVTLTDLGLSRRIPQPPDSPLLTTRCGSEDYAAPEILLGQPYDGRSTDAWALGILLYALMEGRLPFDAPPGKPERSRNTHRIARCDWIWCRFGDDEGDWDPSRAEGFEDARPCVEGLLKKVRMGRKSLDEIGEMEWARNGIRIPGGLKRREEDEDDEML